MLLYLNRILLLIIKNINNFFQKNLIILVLVFTLIGISLFFYFNENECGDIISSEEVGIKTINYINENLLQEPNETVLISSAKEGFFYKLKLKIGIEELDVYTTQDGKFLFVQPPINLEETIELPLDSEEAKETIELTIGSFSISKDEICKEDEKPIVYFFGSTSCPHCLWEEPVLEKVMENFKDSFSFHKNIDSTNDMDIFSKYNPDGGVPTIIIGCKYYRVGSGERIGEEEEARILTALLCELNNNNPDNICQEVQDLISQINN